MSYNNQEKGSKIRLTIICLSYERQPIMRRQLLYYANKPVHIIFADGSAEPWSLGYQGTIGSLTWEYFNIAGGAGLESAYQRFIESVQRVKTEYVTFLDDEECLLWTGLQRAMSFLDEHPEHICAGGQAFHAGSHEGKYFIHPWERWASPWSLECSDPLQRFKMMVDARRTANLYYQVLRSIDLVKFGLLIPRVPYKYIVGLEILFTGFLSLCGKWKMGNYPFWIRHGGSIAPPLENKVDYLSEDEMKDIAKRLASLFVDGSNIDRTGRIKQQLDYKNEIVIFNILNSQYGQRAMLNKRNTEKPKKILLNWFQVRIYKKLRRQSSLLLKKSMPPYFILIIRRLRGSKESSANSFETYAMNNAKGDLLVIQDVLLIKIIWEAYPEGFFYAKNI